MAWGRGRGAGHLLCSCQSHAPFRLKDTRGRGGASSSRNRANSLLSNLSARQARMVVTVPGPGSCTSEASCLMAVKTNCSVDAAGAEAAGNNTNRTTGQYTHTPHARQCPLARFRSAHVGETWWNSLYNTAPVCPSVKLPLRRNASGSVYQRATSVAIPTVTISTKHKCCRRLAQFHDSECVNTLSVERQHCQA